VARRGGSSGGVEYDIARVRAELEAVTITGPAVPFTRVISTSAPLTGGGDLCEDRALGVSAATTSAVGVVELATSGESAPGVVVQGDDSRLSDARTPLAHSHQISDVTSLQTSLDGKAAATHAASHQPGGGDAMTVDAVAGTGSLRTIGTGAQQACAGNDARLSDARTPTAHTASHKHGGADEVATATAGANAIPKAGAGGTLVALVQVDRLGS